MSGLKRSLHEILNRGKFDLSHDSIEHIRKVWIVCTVECVLVVGADEDVLVVGAGVDIMVSLPS